MYSLSFPSHLILTVLHVKTSKKDQMSSKSLWFVAFLTILLKKELLGASLSHGIAEVIFSGKPTGRSESLQNV